MKKYQINYPALRAPLQNLKGMFSPFSLLLFSFLLFSFLPYTAFAQKQKTTTQTAVLTDNFKVKQKNRLVVDTRYTKIVFEEWEKNEIDFTTTVTLKRATEKEMEQVLNGLNITAKQFGKEVTYNLAFSSSFEKNKKNITEGLEINLIVKIPKEIFLSVTSRYGNVEVADVHLDFNADITYGNLNGGNLYGLSNKINIKYGNLRMNNLSGSNNIISLKYGNFNIQRADQLSFDIKYCNGTLKEAGTLKLNAKYCTLKMDAVESLEFDSGYDKISIENSAGNLKGTMKYGMLNIASLKYSFNVNLSYSKLNIYETLASFTKIDILANQSNIVLNIPKNLSFEFEYSGKYTDFKDKDVRWNYATFEAGSNSLQVSGFYGNNHNSGRLVKIRANYGSVAVFGR